ncbi:lytic transglycosylase domain-containing protein, partial [Bradyrhizobium sp. UFLA 03-164]|nr:lytic transglycosylase domain-containing protein [Bradyrhizobium uaiense]
QANLVPEELVHRVIVRESKYQPHLIGRGGAIGMMQIKLATAREITHGSVVIAIGGAIGAGEVLDTVFEVGRGVAQTFGGTGV